MDAPPVVDPAPPAQPPRFSLPAAAWIAWGIFGAVVVGLAATRGGALTPFATGQIVGTIVAALLLSTLASWVVWRLSGRSFRARTVAFLVMLGVVALGQIVQAQRRATSATAYAELEASARRAREEQRAASEKGDAPDEKKAMEFLANASTHLSKAAANSTGRDRAAAEAGLLLTEKIEAAAKIYYDTVAKLGLESFFELSVEAEESVIENRRQAVAAFASANTTLRTVQKDGRAIFQQALEARGITGRHLQALLAGFDESGGNKAGIMVKIRDLDAQMAAAMSEFLDEVATRRKNPGLEARLAFTERYLEISERVTKIGAEQMELQKQATAK